MPTKMLGAAAGLALLLTASLGYSANATTLSAVGTLPATSPVQNIACWCGPYRCACRHRYWGPATMVTMDPAIMDPATMVGGGQVWGSMSDLVGVGGISLLSSDRLSALTAGKPRLANGAESHRTTSLGYAHST
jgi:hypothetical protein